MKLIQSLCAKIGRKEFAKKVMIVKNNIFTSSKWDNGIQIYARICPINKPINLVSTKGLNYNKEILLTA